jgi:hypothetical protein
VAAERIFECPHATTTSGDLRQELVEGTSATTGLTISNIAVEPNQPLTWTITEALSSCTSPSDLSWVSASSTAGTTPTGSTAALTVTFNATGLSAPDTFSGLLCITSNDPGEPVIALPISLQVQYPFGGFLEPIDGGLNTVQAGVNVPVKFQIGGQRTSVVLAAGSPVSVQIDCSTLAPIGPEQATRSDTGLVWSTDKYQYDWKTLKSWKGTCRQLVLRLDDGSVHVADFRFAN